MIIFGIDPGVSGAICVLKEREVIEVYEMPTMIDGKKNKRQVNGAEVTNIFKKELINENNRIESSENYEKIAKVVVEHVTAMPGQGVTSMFNFVLTVKEGEECKYGFGEDKQCEEGLECRQVCHMLIKECAKMTCQRTGRNSYL